MLLALLWILAVSAACVFGCLTLALIFHGIRRSRLKTYLASFVLGCPAWVWLLMRHA